jgi:hypothetical protein
MCVQRRRPSSKHLLRLPKPRLESRCYVSCQLVCLSCHARCARPATLFFGRHPTLDILLQQFEPISNHCLVYLSAAVCSRRTRTWWAGRGIHGGSAELEGGATVYPYSMEAFALAMVVHYTSFWSCTNSCIGSWLRLPFRCWVFSSNLTMLPIRAGFRAS